MLQAFVGIVSCQGLEILCPEDPATIRFLWRRVARGRLPAACFWSVLPHEAVLRIETALDLGETGTALHLLQLLARDGGPLAPPSDADDWTTQPDRA
jgi:hypothetical protein